MNAPVTALGLVSAALTALAAALAVSRPTRVRAGSHPWLSGLPAPRRPSDDRTTGSDRSLDLVERQRVAIAVLAGLAPVVLLGGAAGVITGAFAAVVAHRLIAGREPTSDRRRREAVARSLPQVVDLLAVTLASGASPAHALRTVAHAVEGPVVAELTAVEHSLALGRDPVTVWREVSLRPGLVALGRVMTRAVETGASVSDCLHRLAEDLHSVARLDGESRARAVGVRAAAPLGLCLLPAFVLVGVVPLVAGTVGTLLAP